MSDEGFLRRWSRLKADPAAAQPAVAPAAADKPPQLAVVPASEPHLPRTPQRPDTRAPALPTLDDVARLDADSDFSVFVTEGVDKDVRRLAMKKLFSDPHFNLVDRLDVYMDDYNKPSPMSAAMLAALHHTKNLFAPLSGDIKEGDADAPAVAGEGVAATAGAATTDGDLAEAAGAVADPAMSGTEPVMSGTEPVMSSTDPAMNDNGPAVNDIGPGVEPAVVTAAPIQLAPMQFHGAASGVLQQTQQGKA